VSEDCLSFYKADGTLAAVLTSQLFAVGAKCMNPNFRQTEQDGLDWSGQRLALPLPHKSFGTFVMNAAVQVSPNSIPRFDPI